MNHLDNFITFESCTNRHWCPISERYTGADSLLTAQDRGWQIASYNKEQSKHVTTVYVFTLYKQDQVAFMRIITNPVVERVIAALDKAADAESITQSEGVKLYAS